MQFTTCNLSELLTCKGRTQLRLALEGKLARWHRFLHARIACNYCCFMLNALTELSTFPSLQNYTLHAGMNYNNVGSAFSLSRHLQEVLTIQLPAWLDRCCCRNCATLVRKNKQHDCTEKAIQDGHLSQKEPYSSSWSRTMCSSQRISSLSPGVGSLCRCDHAFFSVFDKLTLLVPASELNQAGIGHGVGPWTESPDSPCSSASPKPCGQNVQCVLVVRTCISLVAQLQLFLCRMCTDPGTQHDILMSINLSIFFFKLVICTSLACIYAALMM